MQIFNIPNTYHSISDLRESLFRFLKNQQSKVVVVAILALSCLAACYLSVKYLKMKWQRRRDKLFFVPHRRIESPCLAKRGTLQSLPNDFLISCFTFLGKKEWRELTLTNHLFHTLSQQPTVIRSLLEKHSFDLDLVQKLTKVAGSCLSLNIVTTISNRQTNRQEAKEAINQLLIEHPNMIKLCLSVYWLNDQALASLSLPPKLEFLGLSSWGLTTLSPLPPNLRSLNLADCHELTNAALAHLPPNLESLNFDGSWNLTTLPHLSPNLRFLNLTRCYGLTNAALAHLPPNLESLNLSGCSSLTAAVLAHLPSSLRSLNLAYCSWLTNAALAQLPPNLQFLDLSCSSITHLFPLPPNLQSLNLSQCRLIDAALIHLPLNLQSLDLSQCYQLTDAALTYLPPNLQSLKVECSQFSNAALDNLRLRSLNLKIRIL